MLTLEVAHEIVDPAFGKHREMRGAMVEKLKAKAPGHDFEFVREQVGMFSYSGLSKAQVDRLRDEFGIYAVGTGRICVAALNQQNLGYVAEAVRTVSRG